MTLYIKNMVCNRCKAAVRTIIEPLGLHIDNIALGEVEVSESSLPPLLLQQLSESLQNGGFELIDDRKSRMIEKIKNVVVDLVHYTDDQPRQKHSDLIVAQLHYDYSYLSRLFSEVEGITIERYIIHQKVEKIKEFLVYDELSLSEIAFRMGYSSVAHLSAQFKKVTGLSPSHFKSMRGSHRKPLDEVGRQKSKIV
jgi:AraC family transcriptional regulator